MSSTLIISSFTTRNAAWLAATSEPRPPPPGVIPNFDTPNMNGTIFIVICTVGLLLALICTMMRIYTKAFLTQALGWDDYTCVLAMIGIFFWAGFNIRLTKLGMGVHTWNFLATNAAVEQYYHTAFELNTVYFIVVCLIKISIILFYLRAFSTVGRIFRWTMYIVLFFMTLFHVLAWIFLWIQATPLLCVWGSWPTDEAFHADCQSHFPAKNYIIFISVLTIVLDIIILAVPCPHVWRLQMVRRQKMAILGILLAGAIVTIASILRLVYLLRLIYFTDDTTFTEFQVNLISTIEIEVGVICNCLPTLQAFLKRFAPRLLNLPSNKGGYSSNRPRKLPTLQQSNKPEEKPGNKWRDEELINDSYIELGDDGKSDQSYAMTTKLVKPQSV